MVAPAEAVAPMPDDLPADEAAPLLCAGITVFNALAQFGRARRRTGRGARHRRPGSSRDPVCAADGISHRRDRSRRRQAASGEKLGAHEYIDTNAGAPAAALQKLGGADVILATAPDSKSMSALVDGLAPNGTLMVVGADIAISHRDSAPIHWRTKIIQGWASGTAKDSEDTLQFSSLAGVRPMIERYPLEKAAEAYEQMISGRARFRVVLTMS